MVHRPLLSFFFLLVCSLFATGGHALAFQVIYVDQSNTGGMQNGSDWVNSMTSLDLALAMVSGHPIGNREIWVAKGTYKPSQPMISGDEASKSFFIPENTRMYGGFSGIESNIDQRDGTLYVQTVLSGKYQTAQGEDKRLRHVVFCQPGQAGHPVAPVTWVDGFQIQAGLAVGDPSIQEQNNGGAIYASGISLIVRNSEFVGNLAMKDGGAIYWESGPITLFSIGLGVSRSRFVQNTALRKGGAVCAISPNRIDGFGDVQAGQPPSHLVNCTFSKNIAGRSDLWDDWVQQGGGAVYYYHPVVNVDGCVFSFNQSRGHGSAVKVDWDYFASGASPASSPMPYTFVTAFGNEVLAIPGYLPVGVTMDMVGAVFYSQPQPPLTSNPPPSCAATSDFTDSIVWGNRAYFTTMHPTTGLGVAVDNLFPSDQFHVSYSDIELQDKFLTWPDATGAGTNLNLDPKFEVAFLGDFRLSFNSPCRDQHVVTPGVFFVSDTADIDEDGARGTEELPFSTHVPQAFFQAHGQGVPRRYGSGTDMGAMETP